MADRAPLTADRRAMLAKIAIATKGLGIEDGDYRALLLHVTGHRSARDCDDRQLALMADEMKRLGFRFVRSSNGRVRIATHPIALKARALWISLHQLGAIDDPSERALEALGKRQLGVDRLQWTNQSQSYPLIEALKAIAERHGWDQRIKGAVTPTRRVRVLRERLYAAIGAKLVAAGCPLAPALPVVKWHDADLDFAIVSAAAALASVQGPSA